MVPASVCLIYLAFNLAGVLSILSHVSVLLAANFIAVDVFHSIGSLQIEVAACEQTISVAWTFDLRSAPIKRIGFPSSIKFAFIYLRFTGCDVFFVSLHARRLVAVIILPILSFSF